MNQIHPTMQAALSPFMPVKNVPITLTADTLAAIARVLVCKKSIALSGTCSYIEQSMNLATVRALDSLMRDNPVQTGLAAMLAEIKAIEDAENGDFAAQRNQLALEADIHNQRNKVHLANLKQTLTAVKLERQFDQVFTA